MERLRGIDPHALDSLLALAFTAAALWTMADRTGIGEDEFRSDDLLGVVLVLLQTLPIALRRVAPLVALSISVAAVALHIALGYQGVSAGTFAALVILYSAASLTDMAGAILAALIAGAGIAIYFATDRSEPGVTAAVSTTATYLAAWGLGVYVRSRREYTSVVEERARLLDQERDLLSREAVASERARIARELHDMVGHALSLIVIQAGGAQRVMQSKPELVNESLASIQTIGRQAMTDMERMLGMLRAPEAEGRELGPQPGLGDVEDLVSTVSGAGLPVEVKVEGQPVPLPPSIDLSAYRIIQEALTNVVKHAGQASAAVRILYGSNDLELEIIDTGQGAGDGGEESMRGGRGLIGMKERVGLFGGDITAGPRPEGGFRVHARLPLGGPTS
jgi:signal transduction histidine kinase